MALRLSEPPLLSKLHLLSELYQGVFLCLPDFRDEPAAGPQVVWTVVQQAAVKIETVRPAVQGGPRLPGSDLGLKRVEHLRVNIRRIGHEQVKKWWARRHGGEQVSAGKRDAVTDPMRMGILLSNRQDRVRPIDRPDLRTRQFSCEGNGNTATAGPNIEDARGGYPSRCQQTESRLNDGLRIGTRNKHAGVDLKLQRPEFLAAGDIGNRLMLSTVDHVPPEVILLRIRNHLSKPSVQAGPADMERMRQQDFRVQARRINIGCPEPVFSPGHELGNRLNAR